MPRVVDDRTQVQVVTLRTEAQLLRTWMARRDDVAQRRREGPLEALKYRRALLQKEVPRLEREVAGLDKELTHQPRRFGALDVMGSVVIGLVLAFAALAWVAVLATLTPDARPDDPIRLGASLFIVLLFTIARTLTRSRRS